MTLTQRYEAILGYFTANMPAAQSELHFDSPYELITAVILSAQCTDRRVNIVTPPLFKAYPTPEPLAEASFEEVFSYVSSISYPNNKAKHLIAMAQMLVRDFGSMVPSDIDDLVKLPGVGIKTANVIASVVYDKPVIAVDTHVFRVSHRIGLSDGKTPVAVQKELEKYISEEDRAIGHHWLILHGRYTCTARSPKCDACGLAEFCREYLATHVKV